MRRIERVAERIVPENPGGVVYGTLVIGALLAAEDGEHTSFLHTIASALVAAALYWLAHAYSELLAQRLSQRRRLTVEGLAGALAGDLAIVRGAALPLAALVLAWIAGASQHSAVSAALWLTVAVVLALEVLAGVRARAGARELALDACVGAALGVAIVALKILLH
ncbi:MAG TPA: hypothetical protein VKV16_02110 [Solirubrobacteraceae bacterium]|nr:hypothetical protein [Solirubrobacteraceae bacterium]